MQAIESIVHSDPDILGGTPVFIGTRVPVQTLLDYLEAGDSLNEFLTDFPSVTREQVVAALQLKEMLVSHLLPLMPSVETALGSIQPGDVVEVNT
jgi:uncharacterized protein (DUF433 family)